MSKDVPKFWIDDFGYLWHGPIPYEERGDGFRYMRFEGPVTDLHGNPLKSPGASWCYRLYDPDPSFSEISKERAIAMLRLHGVKEVEL